MHKLYEATDRKAAEPLVAERKLLLAQRKQ